MYGTTDVVLGGKRQTLALLVVDEPWVMVRISSLISRRGYNIDTITVGKTQVEGVSKIVLDFDGNNTAVQKLIRQMERLESVFKVVHLDSSLQRELCLIHIKTNGDADEEQILSYINKEGYLVISKNESSIIIEATDTPKRIDEMLSFAKQFGILDVSRTGIVAISNTPALSEEECATLNKHIHK